MSSLPTLYIFLDESGNLDFSQRGSRYYIFACVSMERPFGAYPELIDLKYNLLEQGLDVERFHAAEDKQAVRDEVFAIIHRHLPQMRIDSVIVEKRKTAPTMQAEERFYPEMLGYLLRHVCKRHSPERHREIIVITDRPPNTKKGKVIEKTAKVTLAKMLKAVKVPFRVLHHDSRSNFNIQITDYCTWAIHRKWNDGDLRSYEPIAHRVRSEFPIFANGFKDWY